MSNVIEGFVSIQLDKRQTNIQTILRPRNIIIQFDER